MAMQSPIDITRRALVPLGLGPALRFRYPSAPVAVSVRFEVKDGDPVRGKPEVVPQLVVIPQEGEARVEVGADTYLLVSLHWHTPSEHRLEGRPLPVELHLVHRRTDGALLVAGVFYRLGGHNRAIAPAFDLIPRFDPASLAPDRPQQAAAALHLGHLLPEARTTYRYPGSLTTAPFTEGVSWVVFAHPLEAAAEQVAAHDRLVSAPLPAWGDRPHSPGNARRVQDPAGRRVATDGPLG